MTRDKIVDCLRGKEGKPVSIRHEGGTLMGLLEKIVWNTDAFTIRGVKIDTREELFKPENIIEIKEAPMYTPALKVMRMMNEGELE